jgi:hypothetical protein
MGGLPRCCLSITSFMSAISYSLRERAYGDSRGRSRCGARMKCSRRNRHEAYFDRERSCVRCWGTSTRSRPTAAHGSTRSIGKREDRLLDELA